MRNRKRRKNNEPTDHSADCSDYKSSGFYVNYTNVCNYVNYFQLRLLFLRKELQTFSSLLTFNQLSKIYVLYVLPILNIFAKLHFIYHILHFLLCRIVAERTHYERDMGKRDPFPTLVRPLFHLREVHKMAPGLRHQVEKRLLGR